MSKYALGNLLELKRGQDLTKNDMCKGTYPVVGSNGIIGMHNVFNVKAPCITVGRSGTVGAVHYYNENCWAHNTCLYVSDFKNNNPLYLYYLLKNIDLTKVATSTGVPTLNRNFVYPITTTATANLDEQNNIANILGAIDEKIENNDAISAQLEALAKTIYDYWFLQFEFPNEDGKPYKSSGGKMVWNEELKREIPEGWKNGNLYDIANFINGIACQKYPPKDSVNTLPVIKINEMHNGFSAASDVVSNDIPTDVIIQNGDILFSWSASLEAMIWNGGIGGLNQHIFHVLPKKFPKHYVFEQLAAYIVNFKIMAEARKTTTGHITTDHLKQSKIVLPQISIANAYEQNVRNMFDKATILKEETLQLTSLRDFLLPLLMNGQVTFKDKAASEEE